MEAASRGAGVTTPAPAPPSGASAITSDRAHRALLANIRHELATPINAIAGYSEMLLEDARKASQAERLSEVAETFIPDLERINTAAGLLLKMVREALDPDKAEVDPNVNLEQFASHLRHELRTPVNAILGYSEMLLEDAEDSELASFAPDLNRIHDVAQRFLALINDIVKFSMSEAGENTPQFEVVNTSAIMQDVATTVQTLESQGEDEARETGLLLVVDDNEINRDVLSRRLERQGHQVQVAENGLLALESLQAQRFDLVLLDIMMPEMNGYQVLHHMKTEPTLRDIPVIMISALDDIESVARCIEMGAEDYLAKPFNPVLLRGRVEASLEKKRLRDQEVEYLRNVALVTTAAAAVETGSFDPNNLSEAAQRTDELGQLARVFQRMAREVIAREQALRQQVQELKIEIDEANKAKMVAEITKTDAFRQLKDRMKTLRRTSDGSDASTSTE